MTSIHDLAKAHFDKRRGELRAIEVPELQNGADEPPKIFCYDYLTGEELVRLTPFIDWNDPRKTDYNVVFEAFAVGARDQDGKLLFTDVNRHQIKRDWDYAVVSRLVDEMGHLDQLFRPSPDLKKG